MEMTFLDYVKNPSGGRSMMVSEKQLAQSIYTDKYNKMYLRVGGKIDYELFKKDNDRFIIHIKMPSEKTKDLVYDVVIDFYTKDVVQKGLNKLDNYFIRFYSNDPNFTFTFAYVFNERNMIVPELKKKLSRESLKTNPAKTNPSKIVGYVKSLYFAYLFMRERGLFNKNMWLAATNGTNFIKQYLPDDIMDADKKLIQAQNLKKLDKANKSGSVHLADPSDLKKVDEKARNQEIMARSVKIIQKVNRERAKRSKTVSYVKKVKRGH